MKECSDCGMTKPLSDFYAQKKGKFVRRNMCKRCEHCRKTKWNIANPDKRSTHDLMNRYQITATQKRAMFEAQDGKCAICQQASTRSLHLDHNHITGQIRELLCGPCNQAIGLLGEDPDR